MTERAVTTDDGVRLHTRADGDPAAPPLLLINSLGTDLSMWAPQLPGWASDRWVLRYDQRGHGWSDAPGGAYRVERLGRDALAVLDAYGVRAAAVCGLSLGGVVALWLAGEHPDRVSRAVFADTAARVGTEEAWRQRASLVRAEGMAAVSDLVLDRFFSPSFRASGDPLVLEVERGLRDASVDGYAGSCEALAAADLTETAARVSAPNLVVVGSADAATPPEDARRLRGLLGDGPLVELPGAGHLANLEQPDRFAAVVRDFLDDAAIRTSRPEFDDA